MHRTATVLIATLAVSVPAFAQDSGPYKILATNKVGGEGGFDYVTADSIGRKLYVARSGPAGHVTVFNLDTIAPAGEIPGVSGHGATVDVKTGHGFAASKPVTMFDTKALAIIKTIDTGGSPDGYLDDPDTSHVYILSHSAPNITAIDAKDGSIVGTVDVSGAPEQSVLDGKGHLFVDLEDKGSIAVVDTMTLKLVATYPLAGKGDGCAGLAIDRKHDILFAACRKPQNMVILSAKDGSIITSLPIGAGTDGAVFNPATMEIFSSEGEGKFDHRQGEFAHQLRRRTDAEDRAAREDADARYENQPYPANRRRVRPVPATQPGQRPARPPMLPDSFKIITVGK